ncbi:MAG: hypothetical protein PHD61_07435 [Bacteroidales bacterium]|nr:hypothetical protein [Lentimicrobiaceae bacterium]MDD5695121.1 hypothetical protein [Bacteroidales bacterium]
MTRKTIHRFLLFLILMVIVNFMLDWAFKAFSVHNIINETMDRQFAGYRGTMKYLTMGNSHNCINTHILENSFNYGSPSENFIQSYYKLKHILEETGQRPQNLILQADVSSFGPKIANRFEYNSYWAHFINYFELARITGNRDVLSQWLEGRFISYAGNYKDIQLSIFYRIKIKTVEIYNGYRPHRDYRNFANEPNRQRMAWNKAKLILSSETYLDSSIAVYFEKILQLCQENQIRVLMVRIPMSKEFYEEESRIVPVDTLYEAVENIACRYSVYDGLLDYHDLFYDHPEYFFDPDHLNIKGADLFTARLVRALGEVPSAGFSEDAGEIPGNP